MVARTRVSRGDVHLVRLDPTLGSEIRKTRPCVIVSPDELNQHVRTAIVAPMTTAGQAYPWRVPCRFQTAVGLRGAGSTSDGRHRATRETPWSVGTRHRR